MSAFGEAPANSRKTDDLPSANATISGQLMAGKAPMDNGVVFLFDKLSGPPPSLVKYWRIPDRIVFAEKDGKFSIEVPEGTYYLHAAKKNPDDDMGPAKVDELNYFHGDSKGEALPLIIKSGAKLDLGLLHAVLLPVKMTASVRGTTALTGVVSDMDGKPVQGIMVFAYITKNTTGKPVFVSTRTDIDGKFLLGVHDGGTYYLKVRSVIGGGAPENGEFISAEEPVMVTLKKEQKLGGITLKAKKFSRGPKGNKQSDRTPPADL